MGHKLDSLIWRRATVDYAKSLKTGVLRTKRQRLRLKYPYIRGWLRTSWVDWEAADFVYANALQQVNRRSPTYRRYGFPAMNRAEVNTRGDPHAMDTAHLHQRVRHKRRAPSHFYLYPLDPDYDFAGPYVEVTWRELNAIGM